MSHDVIQPEGWLRPKGYSNGILAAPGRTLFVAGQIAWDAHQNLVSSVFAEQFNQALKNVVDIVRAAGGEPTDLCRLTIYVTDKQPYIAQIKDVGAAYRSHLGKHFPTMALVEVADLLEEGAQVEIEGTAVIAAGESS